MRKVLFYLFLLVLLTGCGGGGGDTSSGGGGDFSPEYIGTYKGTLIINATGPGGSVSTPLPVTIVVSNDGRVDVAFDGLTSGGGSCTGDESPVFINGNSFNESATFTCQFPDLGSCSVDATMNGNIANNAISGTGSFVYNCTAGIINASISYTAVKVQSQALSAQSIGAPSTNGGAFVDIAVGILTRNQ